MTNFDIIFSTAIQTGIYTKEEAEKIVKEVGDLPVHTFAEWKRMGHIVKKGEKSRMQCRIWKMTRKSETIPAKNVDGEAVDVVSNSSHYYLTPAYFFTFDQVEPIKEN